MQSAHVWLRGYWSTSSAQVPCAWIICNFFFIKTRYQICGCVVRNFLLVWKENMPHWTRLVWVRTPRLKVIYWHFLFLGNGKNIIDRLAIIYSLECKLISDSNNFCTAQIPHCKSTPVRYRIGERLHSLCISIATLLGSIFSPWDTGSCNGSARGDRSMLPDSHTVGTLHPIYTGCLWRVKALWTRCG